MEKHIATVNVNNGAQDLFITDRRIVVINLAKNNQWGTTVGAAAFGVAGSLIGSGIDALREKDKKAEFENLTVDQILAKDEKSYALDYGQITKVKLNSGTLSKSLEITHPMKTFHVTKKYFLKGEQLDHLRSVLPTIAALSGKLEMKG